MLVVLDGFGLGDGGRDATGEAHAPFCARATPLPHAQLRPRASPWTPPGQMGNLKSVT
jgi:hypothetical protein